MDQCIFCQIIKGEIPSSKIYEDDLSMAFLTIEAINPGHSVVIPKQHESDFQNLDHRAYSAVMNGVKKVALALDKTYSPKKVGLLVQGYEVDHAHVQVVPTYHPGDVTSKKILDGSALKPSREELSAEAASIKSNL